MPGCGRKALLLLAFRGVLGFHELCHYFASVLIDGGESVKAVQARLGHASAEETLNTYAPLWPESEDRTPAVVDAALSGLTARSRPKQGESVL
ncbi:MAG: hypothetical protein QOI76_4369 [Frankiales bacterium]|jgi:integrase|nr:hypothetical protein [Frankiales bacterium]